MFHHHTTHRVRYAETDKMGYLYYGHYATLYEIGRVEMLRSLGLTYRELEDELDVMMPVMSLQMRYVRPAHYDELLTIETTLREFPQRTITFHVEIYNAARKLVNGGSVRLCFVQRTTGTTIAPPTALLDRLKTYFAQTTHRTGN